MCFDVSLQCMSFLKFSGQKIVEGGLNTEIFGQLPESLCIWFVFCRFFARGLRGIHIFFAIIDCVVLCFERLKCIF